MPKRTTDDETRQILLEELSHIIHADFPNHDGTGTFCTGCVAIRSIHALLDIYREIDEPAELIGDEQLEALLSQMGKTSTIPDQTASTPIGELDEIAERILRNRNKDSDEPDDENVAVS